VLDTRCIRHAVKEEAHSEAVQPLRAFFRFRLPQSPPSEPLYYPRSDVMGVLGRAARRSVRL